nr:iron chelate uptake ABC transporter family permease subunit [Raoultibacter timonensis]
MHRRAHRIHRTRGGRKRGALRFAQPRRPCRRRSRARCAQPRDRGRGVRVGYDNRYVLPLSAAAGAAFVVFCDLCSRVLFAPYEVPVGILMAFLGGPFFIYLILKNRKGGLDDRG